MPNLGNSDRIISYLPLSHIAAQLLDIHCPLMTGTQCFFAMPDALRGSIGVTLKEVKPTVFFGVPRVWEKIYDKMQIVAKSTKGLKKKIGAFAKKRAAGHWEAHQYGGSKKSPRFYGLSQKILGKIKQALGLEEVSQIMIMHANMDVLAMSIHSGGYCIPIHLCIKHGALIYMHISSLYLVHSVLRFCCTYRGQNP